MPWSLYCVSVQENPRCDSTARRLSLIPVKSSGCVTLDNSQLSRSPCRLNGSGYIRPLVISLQTPGAFVSDCTQRLTADEVRTRSTPTVCKGATKTLAHERATPC